MSSMKKVPTLKGVFPLPKPPPKRDFLRENKLKLKTLQDHRRDQQFNNEIDEFSTLRNRFHSNNSETRIPSSINSKRINSGCSCSCILRKTNTNISNLTKKKLISNSGLNRNKEVPSILKPHCDRSVQTDDIIDEQFLCNALLKCSSKDSVDIPHTENSSSNYLPDNQGEPTNIYDVNSLPLNNNTNNNDGLKEETRFHHDNSDDINIHNSRKNQQNKACGTLDFGSRREIKIPKYLEREKREKELKRLREMEKDPHCPQGHYVLNEKDRKDALQVAEKQFQELVDELNRMPMSSETLRTRNRKNEIEKALIKLENNIKTFSKQRVYVRLNE